MAYDMEHKTKDYVRRAQDKYINKFDRFNLRLPKGSLDIIHDKIDGSVNNYIVDLIRQDIKNRFDADIDG